MPDVAVSLTNTLLAAAKSCGVDTALALRNCAINEALLRNPDQRIAFSQQEQLWQELAAASKQGNFGLQVGQKSEPGSFNILGMIAMSSANLTEAFTHIQYYQNIVGAGGVIQSLPNNNSTQIRYSPLHAGLPITHQRVAALLASWVKMAHWLLPNFTIQKVSFTADTPCKRADYDELFDCEVLFNQPHNQMQLSSEIMTAPMLQANSSLCEMLSQKAATTLQEIKAGDSAFEQAFNPGLGSFLQTVEADSVTEKVARLIGATLIEGEPDKTQLASALHMSPRSLQRKLSDEKTTFQSLLNALRLHMAQYHLQEKKWSTIEIAYMLGFSEPANFYRAFKKWVGETPGQYRARICS